eukprot:1139616-Pelagomonas_calceolata.AAC.2
MIWYVVIRYDVSTEDAAIFIGSGMMLDLMPRRNEGHTHALCTSSMAENIQISTLHAAAFAVKLDNMSGVSKMVKVLVAFVWVRANVMLLVISTAYDGLEQ